MILKTVSLLMLFALLFATSCSTQVAIPENFKYSCTFDYFKFQPDAPHLKTKQLGEVFAWINKRLKGGTVQGDGFKLAKKVESSHFRDKKINKPDKVFRRIWLIPAAATKKNNPMNVMVDKRGDTYFIIRVDDKHVSNLYFGKNIFMALGGWCPAAE